MALRSIYFLILLFIGFSTKICADVQTFTLQDQRHTAHTIAFPTSNAQIFILADRFGFKQTTPWAKALVLHYKTIPASPHAIAVLSDGNWLYRWIALGFFTHKPPILLDWGGRVARQFSYKAHTCRVVVIDAKGHLLFSTDAPYSDAEFNRLSLSLVH